MDWTRLSQDTYIPELPKVINNNFASTERYLDVFYDASRGILIRPLETTGRVKGASGEFVTVQVDNLIVRSQFTNLLENITTADSDFVNAYNGDEISTRLATSDPSSLARWRPSDGSILVDPSTVLWPLEPSSYSWVDVQTPYIKIGNDASYGFQNDNLGQEFRVLFSDPSGGAPYTLLMESSLGGSVNLTVQAADASGTWIKLITTAYDASKGPVWTVKEFGGTYTIA